MSGKRELRKSEVQAAFKCGEAFQHSAEKLIPEISSVKEETSQFMSSNLSDIIVCATNLAFAIELYLKALIILFDLKVPRTHELNKLYELVPDSVKKNIEGVYHRALLNEIHLGERISFSLAKGPLKKPEWSDYKPLLTLPNLLERSKDLFESWRYIFEFKAQSNGYQFHQFEYGPLRCAAEAIRVEIKVRLDEKSITKA